VIVYAQERKVTFDQTAAGQVERDLHALKLAVESGWVIAEPASL